MNVKRTYKSQQHRGLTLHIVVLEDGFDDWVANKWPDDPQTENKNGAYTVVTWPDAWMVFCSDDMDHNSIGHEAMHCTLKVMRDIGMKESEDSEEAYCYFNGWVKECIYRAIKRPFEPLERENAIQDQGKQQSSKGRQRKGSGEVKKPEEIPQDATGSGTRLEAEPEKK